MIYVTLLLHIFFCYYIGKIHEVLVILQTMDIGNIKQQKVSRVQEYSNPLSCLKCQKQVYSYSP